MEKFVDYGKWFEIISQSCSEANFMESRIEKYYDHEEEQLKDIKYDCYVIDKDISVCKSDNQIIVMKSEDVEQNFEYGLPMGNMLEIQYYDDTKKDYDVRFDIWGIIDNDLHSPSIVYSSSENGFNSFLPVQEEELESGNEEYYIYKSASEQNINKLLEETIEEARNNPNADLNFIKEYEGAIEFYNKILHLVMQKEKQTVNLETNADEIEKKDLINEIKKEQKIGAELDMQIKEVKENNKTIENR